MPDTPITPAHCIGCVLLPDGPFRGPPDLGEYRNFYCRSDGTVRVGPAWRDRQTAATMAEQERGERFITCRNMRFEDTQAFVASLVSGGSNV